MSKQRTAQNFNIATAAGDFAGDGRSIEILKTAGKYGRRQMKLTVNGWTFSVIWGFGTYCTAARPGGWQVPHDPSAESPDAEIAVWKGDGPMIQLGDDTVAGWVSAPNFLAALKAAETDDEDAIRAALLEENT